MPVRLGRLTPYGILLGLSVGLVIGVSVARLAELEGGLVYHDIPAAGGELHAPADPASSGPPAPEPDPAPGGPPVDPLAALLEPGPYGALPRVAADGTSPFAYYRRADSAPPADVPLLSLLVIDAGLARERTLRALELPEAVAVGFSPYASALEAWMRYARARGHETLLELPLAAGEPYDDAGPLAFVPAAAKPPEPALQRLLARGQGYFAVVLSPAAGEEARSLGALVRELGRRGLGLVETGGEDLRELAREAGVPYLGGALLLDAEPSPTAVDWALGALEARALKLGGALGAFRASPLMLDRLRQWLPSLPEKGFLLVPPSRLFGRVRARDEAGAS